MKGGTVQILWHGSEPILTLDFHLSTGLLATGGAERDIKLWSIHRVEKSKAIPSATFKANLSYHTAAVNMLRFSRSGELLASCADNSELLIWKISDTEDGVPTWKVWKNLRGHTKDVLGLDWSSDDNFLVSCSVDNTCLIWNIAKGGVEQIVSGHQHYVQGVAWDPTDKYLASVSGDRSCRIYSAEFTAKKGKSKEKNPKRHFYCQHVLSKAEAIFTSSTSAGTGATEAPLKQAPVSKQYLFHDENMPSFFRRLSWSPDGSFLLIPAGIEKHSPEASSTNVSYIVSRRDLSRPLLSLPAASKPVVATRFCPVLFSLAPKEAGENRESGAAVFDLPYKLIFAVATMNSVYIYDSERNCPIAILGGLHFAPITDIAWSHDAKFLAISSQDGYCTLVGFDEGDLGTPASLADLPSNVASLLPAHTAILSNQIRSMQGEASGKADCSLRDCTELGQTQVTTQKDQSVQSADVQFPGESRKTLSRKGGTSQNVRRLNPTLIPGNSQASMSVEIKVDATRLTIDSGGSMHLKSRDFHSPGNSSFGDRQLSDARCGQNIAQVSADPQFCAPKVDLDRMNQNQSEALVAPSKADCVHDASRPDGGDCQAKGEETARSPESAADFSKSQPCAADSAQGPSTPACLDHGSGLGDSPVTAVKPVDFHSDIYVRPLKIRRVSPCIGSHHDEESDLKPVSRDVIMS